jgi:ferredoxin
VTASNLESYRPLAQQLDALPQGFPATEGGVELRLLAKLFSPAEAEIAAHLGAQVEPVEAIAARAGRPGAEVRALLKGMARRGLIDIGRVEGGLGYGLLPFVVGFFENQNATIDEELAGLVEEYFAHGFGQMLQVTPQFHRIVPVGEAIQSDMEIRPYETATDLVNAAQAWGVLDCICRKQKALIGQACGHPVDVCMTLSDTPGAFDTDSYVHAVTREEALATLKRSAEAGLVHSVSNSQAGVHYICNCCTCSCGILRGMADLGISNVMARSAYVIGVDLERCSACEACVSACAFDALAMDVTLQTDGLRCVGCGVCVAACPEEALSLSRRPERDVLPVPETPADWRAWRLAARGL